MLIIRDNFGQVLAKSSNELISLGREEDNTIQVKEDSVSSYHGIFFKADSLWIFRDNFSTNGTYYNGKLMRGGQIKLVKENDILRFSSFNIQCELTEKNKIGSSILLFKGFDALGVFEIDQDEVVVNSAVIEDLDAELKFARNEIGALSFDTTSELLINGDNHSGKIALLDQDQIDVGDYSFFVLYGEIKAVRPKKSSTDVSSSKQVADTAMVEQASDVRTSEAFVFNSQSGSTEGFSRPATMSGPKRSEMSMSQKLSSIADEEYHLKEAKKDNVFAILGLITLITLISFIIFASSML